MRDAITLPFSEIEINETFIYLHNAHEKKGEDLAYNIETQTFVTIKSDSVVMTVR